MSKKTLIIPPKVSNLVADAQPSNVRLSYDDIVELFSVKVYRSVDNDILNSSTIGTAMDSQFIDNNVVPGNTYYYWAVTLSEDGTITSDWAPGYSQGLQVQVPKIIGSDTDADTFFYMEKQTTITPTPLQSNVGFYEAYTTTAFDGYGGVIEVYFSAYFKITNLAGLNNLTVSGDFKTQFQQETSPGVWSVVSENIPIRFLTIGKIGSATILGLRDIHFTGFQSADAGSKYRGVLLIDINSDGQGNEMEVTQFREMVKVHKTEMATISALSF